MLLDDNRKNGERFLIDTVSISRISEASWQTMLSDGNCFIPDEIVYEARGNTHRYEQMKKIILETNYDVLIALKEVLSFPEIDHKVLDLYNNEGNGDVMLLASAIADDICVEQKLFKDENVIVTDDKRLSMVAGAHGIRTYTTDEFVKRPCAKQNK